MPADLLIIFARDPVPGKVKRRLSAELGDEDACRIYQVLLDRTLELASTISMEVRVSIDTGQFSEQKFERFPFELTAQYGISLGERMSNEISRAFKDGYQRVGLLGSDIRDLQLSDIEKAFRILQEKQAVIGPAMDGGYYLIGFNVEATSWERSFVDVEWGTDQVFETTLKKWKELGLRWGEIPMRRDVDREIDIDPELRKLAAI